LRRAVHPRGPAGAEPRSRGCQQCIHEVLQVQIETKQKKKKSGMWRHWYPVLHALFDIFIKFKIPSS
jgi:hypothetical protein